jgi:predicted nucleic acid-binding protein
MSARKLTFVDASVLINAIVGQNASRKMRALSVLGDPHRNFISTEYLRLKILPIPTAYRKSREIAFYERFFQGVSNWIDCASLITPAYRIACKHGVGALDALHLAAAASESAEFDSAEKPTKPIYSAYKRVSSIY